jgi:thioredoxin-related protein
MRFFTSTLVMPLLLGLPLRAEKEGAIQWTPFTQGVKNAMARNKYVFVDVYTDWCGYCKQLDAFTFRAAPVLAELNDHFISVKLNAESDAPLVWKDQRMSARDLTMQWGIDSYPTFIFLNSKGNVIGSFSSFAEPDLMVKLLTYISSGAREREVDFDDYLKGKS